MQVPTTKPEFVFQQYGIPYFVKIDIEGYDTLVVDTVARLTQKPAFLSVEDNGIETLIALYNSGARAFKFVDQIDKWKLQAPHPPLEGNYVEWAFGAKTSGPFGNELPGEWVNIHDALDFYISKIRPGGKLPDHRWWDIHVSYA